mmetsp:Transcript_10408/g.11894  ORF Transcript_10408/g.11894 Transcript_10408/m.11894 type:complete len:478 (-) Transcript_10408:114-1547(-)
MGCGLVISLLYIVSFFICTNKSLEAFLLVSTRAAKNKQTTTISKNEQCSLILMFVHRKHKNNDKKLREGEDLISPIHRQRQPNKYWNNIENVRKELFEFWDKNNVTSVTKNKPPIPSETLLNYFGRHDLRQVVKKYGGRDTLSLKLGGEIEIIHGKWSIAVNQSLVVQELIHKINNNLRADIPPLSPQQRKEAIKLGIKVVTLNSTKTDKDIIIDDDYRIKTRWSHNNNSSGIVSQGVKKTRRPYNYWTERLVLQKLYDYMNETCKIKQRPSIWMPQLSEIRSSGREDLYQAIQRFGGAQKIAYIAGLVPYCEWQNFEEMFFLMKETARFLDQYHDGNRLIFPSGKEINEKKEFMELYYLIRKHGGVYMVSSRLGFMERYGRSNRRKADGLELMYGPFSIDFGIELFTLIRTEQMKVYPPTSRRSITIPSEYELFRKKRDDLNEGIHKYGGHENVARRLGLALFQPTREKKGKKYRI